MRPDNFKEDLIGTYQIVKNKTKEKIVINDKQLCELNCKVNITQFQ